MQKRYLITGLVLVLSVACLAVSARFLTAPPAPEQSLFPDKLNVRVLLPKEELNESRRVAYYEKDNTTLRSLEVEYRDGFTGLAKFKSDGTIATFTKFYPHEDHETPQAQKKLVYSDDGEHIASEEQFYRSGALKRTGNRISYGNYAVANYAEGSSTPASQPVFDFDGLAYKEIERHADGQIAKLVRDTKEDGLETFRFDGSGIKMSYHSVKWTTQIVWETYREDGDTLLNRFEQKSEGNQFATSYAIHASYHRADGSVYEKRKFTRTMMTVEFIDNEDNVVYKQVWHNQETQSSNVESFAYDAWVLYGVFIGDDSYWFDRNSGQVNRHNRDVVIKSGDIKTEYWWYHPDGSLAKHRVPDYENGEYKETVFEPGESSKRFDMSELQAFTQAKQFIEPPQVTPVTVTHSGGGH